MWPYGVSHHSRARSSFHTLQQSRPSPTLPLSGCDRSTNDFLDDQPMPGRPSWTLASRGLHECSAGHSRLRMTYTRQPASRQDGPRWLPIWVLIPLLLSRVILTGLRVGFALCCFISLYGRNNDKEAFTALLTCLFERVIIRTVKGYIGLAPETTKKGDTITLLEGGRLPLILRRNGEHWSIVGDCYIHGLMNGEGYDAGKCHTIWIA